jgi:hypothetical protein
MTGFDDIRKEALAPAPDDDRLPLVAQEVRRGVTRLLIGRSIVSVSELPLPNGRRADVVGLSEAGELWVIEIKSCLEDFRTDQKWPEYRDFADRLFFAVRPDFPVDILPPDAGLILADRYGGEIVRDAPEHRLAGARRKSMTYRFARAAALRLAIATDPFLLPAMGPSGT